MMFDKSMDRETVRDLADFERKRRQEMSACTGCGSPEPVRIEGNRCSDCYDGWPRCPHCGGWADVFNHDHTPLA